MSNPNVNLNNPVWIVAAGVAVAIALGGFLWGLAQVLPAVGVAVGLAYSIAVTGGAVGIAATPTLVTVATTGIAITSVSTVVIVAARVVEKATRNPVPWLLPIISVAAGLITELCDEFFVGPKVLWIATSALSSLLVLAGGVLYTRDGWVIKVVGAFLHVIVPLVVLFAIVSFRPGPLFDSIGQVPMTGWAAVGTLAALCLSAFLLVRCSEGAGKASG